MEPGTILAVAQISASLSLRLFSLAGKVKSARADIELIAKDLSAFGPTLKTLHYILEGGHKRGQIPQRAFDDSARLADECWDVFKDIQRETAIDLKLKPPEQVGLPARLKWVFSKKEQVALWQKRLESLKLSITVQISVMHFGHQIAEGGGLGGPLDDSEMVAATRAWKLASDEYAAMRLAAGKWPTAPEPPATQTVDPHYQGTKDIFADSDSDEDIPRPPQRPPANAHISLNKKYNAVWTLVDRLEHALKKTELVAWEQERLEENLETGRHKLPPTKEEVKMHMHRLTKRLQRFGLSPPVGRALAQHLRRGYDHDGGLRFPFHRQSTEPGYDAECMAILKKESIKQRRWATDVVDDVLWESTCVKFGLLGDPPADPAEEARRVRKRLERLKAGEKEQQRRKERTYRYAREDQLVRVRERKEKERLDEISSDDDDDGGYSRPLRGGSSTDSLLSDAAYERPSKQLAIVSGPAAGSGATQVVVVGGRRVSTRPAHHREAAPAQDDSDAESDLDGEESEQWAQLKAHELLQQWTFVRPKRSASVVDH